MSILSIAQNHPLKQYIAEYMDFPQSGVLFRDISPLLNVKFKETIDGMISLLTANEWQKIDAIAGIDARGFILASAIAYRLEKAFIMIRKQGKLPGDTICKKYELEYGTNTIEMQKNTNQNSKTIAVFDDVIATGGSMQASCELCELAGYQIQALVTLVNLTFLHKFSYKSLQVKSLIDY